jgi:hypothetical protein
MASGSSLFPFNVIEVSGPTATYLTPTIYGALNLPILQYPNTLSNPMEFVFVMPQFYSGGGLTILLNWLAETATSGNVRWKVSFSRLNPGNQNLSTPAFSTAVVSGTVAVPGTTGVGGQTIVTVTNGSQMDNVAAGDQFLMKVERDNTVGSNAAGLVDLMSGELRET